MHILWLSLGILCILWRLALAETTCPALRAVEQQSSPTYVAHCSNGTVYLTAAQYNTNKGAGGDFQQFCTPPGTFLSAGEALRWQTPSGRPEVCDVFTVLPGGPVRTADVVYFVHNGGEEQEILTSEHALVYQGNTLVNFNPPVPGIIVQP